MPLVSNGFNIRKIRYWIENTLILSTSFINLSQLLPRKKCMILKNLNFIEGSILF